MMFDRLVFSTEPALTDAQLATEMDFPWGQRGAISRLLAIIPHHHHEHREDVERWLSSRNV